MNLPKLETPNYTLEIPSSGKQVSYRPFLVKEEKVLMIAQESGDEKAVFKAMQDVIKACTFDEVDTKKLTSFDLEYIFIKLRAKSVGEEVKIGVKCTSCGESHPVTLNLDAIQLSKSSPLPKKIALSGKIGIIPRYLSATKMQQLVGIKDQATILTKTIAGVIESIYDEKNVYPLDDASDKEIEEFIGSLNREQLKKIEAVIANAPRLEQEIEFKCAKCGTQNAQVLSGTQSFFA